MSGKLNPRLFTRRIKMQYGGHILYAVERFPHGYLYGYDKGERVWREVSGETERFLRENLPSKNLSNYTIREIMGGLCQSLYRPMPEEPPWNLINFRNGIWDVKKGGFVNLDGRDEPPFFLSQIPHNLALSNLDSRRIDNLFQDWVPNEYVIPLYEVAGYCLLRCNSAQKFFNPFGDGDNGKSTYANLLKKIVGFKNCSSLSMDDLMGDKFSLASLPGKLVNITGELASTLKRSDKIKLLTGGDSVFAQQKFKSGFFFTAYTKLIFMGNVIPLTPDSSPAFYRRTFVIPFPNTISKKKKDPNLLDSISEEEIQGALAKIVLNILPPFIERRFRFSLDPSVSELRDQWETLSNPLKVFLEEYFRPSPGNVEFIPNPILWQLYREHCKKHGVRQLLNARDFSDLMRKEGYKPGRKRLSPQEIQRFQREGFPIPSPCRGWFCDSVTLVTPNYSYNKNEFI